MVKQRDGSIDNVRLFGFFAVVVLHVFSQVTPDISYRSLVDHATRWAVPAYFTISGYLFELRNRSLLEKWSRMMVRILTIFTFWEVVYLIADRYYFHVYEAPASKVAFLFQTLFRGGVAWHLWFLPSLIASTTAMIVLRPLGWYGRIAVAFDVLP